ncbi:FAD-linked oxidoreductase YitY [Acrasis kona]|uniref:FAD-linked oxidoreductase YitY n=1 Tax=Acrasis kona TaxID=1008807 RepID=A0AAW2ZQF5_9EUKA
MHPMSRTFNKIATFQDKMKTLSTLSSTLSQDIIPHLNSSTVLINVLYDKCLFTLWNNIIKLNENVQDLNKEPILNQLKSLIDVVKAFLSSTKCKNIAQYVQDVSSSTCKVIHPSVLTLCILSFVLGISLIVNFFASSFASKRFSESTISTSNDTISLLSERTNKLYGTKYKRELPKYVHIDINGGNIDE